jgi:hypothetical protein
MCILFNQRDAANTTFFFIFSALQVAGGFSAPHKGLPIHPSGRQQESMTIPKAANTVL